LGKEVSKAFEQAEEEEKKQDKEKVRSQYSFRDYLQLWLSDKD